MKEEQYISKRKLENFAMKCVGGSVTIMQIHNFKQEDVVPVVHAKWMPCQETYSGPDTYNYFCTACREYGGTWARGLEPEQLPRFCMWCGARMDSEK